MTQIIMDLAKTYCESRCDTPNCYIASYNARKQASGTLKHVVPENKRPVRGFTAGLVSLWLAG